MKTVRKMTNQTSPCSIYLITLTTIPSFLFHLYIINVKNISLWLANSSKQPCPVAIPATPPPPSPKTEILESIAISTITQTAM